MADTASANRSCRTAGDPTAAGSGRRSDMEYVTPRIASAWR
jgi:hypothetical protein